MKNIVLSTVAVLAMSSFAVAGGDIAPVEEPVVVVEPVVTDAGFYLGLGYSFINSDIDFKNELSNTHSLGADYSAVMFQAGYKFNQYVAVEGRYWLGVADEGFSNVFNDGDTFDTDATAWGIYVKPMYPVTENFDIYGLLGYGSSTIGGVNTGTKIVDLDSDGLSWGVGAAYSFTDNVSVFLDYVAFTDDTLTDNAFTGLFNDSKYDQSFETINFGVTYKF
ncbi:putative outer membrane protein A [hydrothermal vent metagenome]|uniref:Putative outer membrane protein A n=1 Tax=hydrothermal vent metagenome TaxID=652676 RepID=A0A1W1EDG3_9ZZZZ